MSKATAASTMTTGPRRWECAIDSCRSPTANLIVATGGSLRRFEQRRRRPGRSKKSRPRRIAANTRSEIRVAACPIRIDPGAGRRHDRERSHRRRVASGVEQPDLLPVCGQQPPGDAHRPRRRPNRRVPAQAAPTALAAPPTAVDAGLVRAVASPVPRLGTNAGETRSPGLEELLHILAFYPHVDA